MRGAWVAQLVKRLPLVQVCAQCPGMEPSIRLPDQQGTCFFFPSASSPFVLSLSLTLTLSQITEYNHMIYISLKNYFLIFQNCLRDNLNIELLPHYYFLPCSHFYKSIYLCIVCIFITAYL